MDNENRPVTEVLGPEHWGVGGGRGESYFAVSFSIRETRLCGRCVWGGARVVGAGKMVVVSLPLLDTSGLRLVHSSDFFWPLPSGTLMAQQRGCAACGHVVMKICLFMSGSKDEFAHPQRGGKLHSPLWQPICYLSVSGGEEEVALPQFGWQP